MEMCFSRIDPKLAMPRQNIHFPTGDLEAYSRSFDLIKCLVMQGGQGEVKHWAFNDPPRRIAPHRDAPPSPSEYRKLSTRIVDLHPMTVIQNARTSGGGYVSNPFGIRLTALMISRKITDSSVPMSLLADHPRVHFHFYRKGLGTVTAEMH
jgi:glucosamine-6-phosphate deaminase